MGSNKEWLTESYTADYNSFDDLNTAHAVTSTQTSPWPTGDQFNLPFDHNVELMNKYPALKQAWEHYQTVLKMCNAKESENEN